MEEFNKESFLEEITKSVSQAQERFIVDDILDIYNGKYNQYYSYVNAKKFLIEKAREQNQKIYMKDNEVKYSIFVEPVILSGETYTYICERAEADGEAKENEHD